MRSSSGSTTAAAFSANERTSDGGDDDASKFLREASDSDALLVCLPADMLLNAESAASRRTLSQYQDLLDHIPELGKKTLVFTITKGDVLQTDAERKRCVQTVYEYFSAQFSKTQEFAAISLVWLGRFRGESRQGGKIEGELNPFNVHLPILLPFYVERRKAVNELNAKFGARKLESMKTEKGFKILEGVCGVGCAILLAMGITFAILGVEDFLVCFIFIPFALIGAIYSWRYARIQAKNAEIMYRQQAEALKNVPIYQALEKDSTASSIFSKARMRRQFERRRIRQKLKQRNRKKGTATTRVQFYPIVLTRTALRDLAKDREGYDFALRAAPPKFPSELRELVGETINEDRYSPSTTPRRVYYRTPEFVLWGLALRNDWFTPAEIASELDFSDGERRLRGFWGGMIDLTQIDAETLKNNALPQIDASLIATETACELPPEALERSKTQPSAEDWENDANGGETGERAPMKFVGRSTFYFAARLFQRFVQKDWFNYRASILSS